jgi:hypothetical protein
MPALLRGLRAAAVVAVSACLLAVLALAVLAGSGPGSAPVRSHPGLGAAAPARDSGFTAAGPTLRFAPRGHRWS